MAYLPLSINPRLTAHLMKQQRLDQMKKQQGLFDLRNEVPFGNDAPFGKEAEDNSVVGFTFSEQERSGEPSVQGTAVDYAFKRKPMVDPSQCDGITDYHQRYGGPNMSLMAPVVEEACREKVENKNGRIYEDNTLIDHGINPDNLPVRIGKENIHKIFGINTKQLDDLSEAKWKGIIGGATSNPNIDTHLQAWNAAGLSSRLPTKGNFDALNRDQKKLLYRSMLQHEEDERTATDEYKEKRANSEWWTDTGVSSTYVAANLALGYSYPVAVALAGAGILGGAYVAGGKEGFNSLYNIPSDATKKVIMRSIDGVLDN